MKPDQAPFPVAMTSASLQMVRTWYNFNRRVAAIETVEIRPRANGDITQTDYREGFEVNNGHLFFVTD
ncbi:hypothetical protein HX787_21670 [Pseudomonas tolaasii]|uniref:Uncharacterized protein n=1 Tax=Pseudomonas tolaasii TaxID=29442 RepID=A0A7Y8ATF8_PSETO|nr:hypothetical protein [Pseudomonas tolaasii]KAB0470545.1 hypothetical protein F7R12_20055 [Pseudomonas tolaasii]MBY8944005.1 hypothetical protein [Pseudomonas tolaasii]NVZ45348.1 hypothetical protein [Pseudomonas tolaasii]NWA48672.1 hypothetical protein [Pseudomonas tolaasii]NWC22338.1 hypothetical protein [Pseudomonas tolaasii]